MLEHQAHSQFLDLFFKKYVIIDVFAVLGSFGKMGYRLNKMIMIIKEQWKMFDNHGHKIVIPMSVGMLLPPPLYQYMKQLQVSKGLRSVCPRPAHSV